MLFHGVSYSQENNSLKQSDSASIYGNISLDFMSWAGYTRPYTYSSNTFTPYTVNQPGVYTCAFKDVAYRFRATYKLKRFRVGLDFSFKEIIKKEELTSGIMTNGFQTIDLTTEPTFYKHNRLEIGGLLNLRIFHNKFNEDVQNDLLQVGVIGTYSINPNISVLFVPVFSYNNNINGWNKNSFYINAGIRLTPSKTDLGEKKISRKIYFSVAIACHNNLTKQNLELIYKGDRYFLYPYKPIYDGVWNENGDNFKNAFATPGCIFPLLELGVQNNKKVSHIIGAGYSSLSDSAGTPFGVGYGKEKIVMQNFRVYYQYNQTLFKKSTNNYSKSSVYPYIGGQFTLNFKKMKYQFSAMGEGGDLQHYYVNYNYNDSCLEVTTQFLFGIRSNHNKLFFDTGICFNLIARSIINSDVLDYVSTGSSSSENFELQKTIYIGNLWKNHLFADNIYFKIGYRF
jgi:hypothetical protein